MSVTDELIPGGWTEREVLLGARTLRILLPAMPDEFLEELERTASDAQEADPYWAELWPASLPMARLVYAANWSDGAHAIELGCGIGVVGLAALLAGLDVTFTDRVELAVATAVENAHCNGFPAARGFVLDWTQPPRQQYPIILASDVLYDRGLHAPLLRAIESLLTDGGECWLADPGRSATASFLEQVASTEFELQLRDEEGRPAANLKLGEFRLMVLRKTSNGVGGEIQQSNLRHRG
ncbi:MAG: methyltransferase domain-containing protein [Planctomycetia bacterium]|nr:methyltransferase domain-containing protein [Planctomycetia bacterium]